MVFCLLQNNKKNYFLTVRKIIRFDFADELKMVGLRYVHRYNLNNNQTSIIWSHIIFNKLLSKTYRFRVIGDLLKVVGWQKVRFSQKVCKNSLIKIKTDFFQKNTFFESPIARKRSTF